jgi:hypothetical protein
MRLDGPPGGFFSQVKDGRRIAGCDGQGMECRSADTHRAPWPSCSCSFQATVARSGVAAHTCGSRVAECTDPSHESDIMLAGDGIRPSGQRH